MTCLDSNFDIQDFKRLINELPKCKPPEVGYVLVPKFVYDDVIHDERIFQEDGKYYYYFRGVKTQIICQEPLPTVYPVRKV